MFSWLCIYYAHLASAGFEHSVCRGSLMTTMTTLTTWPLILNHFTVSVPSKNLYVNWFMWSIIYQRKQAGKLSYGILALTLSWRRLLSYRNQPIDLLCKSMDWFLYDNDLRQERVECTLWNLSNVVCTKIYLEKIGSIYFSRQASLTTDYSKLK